MRPALRDDPSCQFICFTDICGADYPAREKRFVAGDLAKNCKLLRQNLADMSGARGPLDRCLTGHERGETVAQMDASIEDIRAVLADKCPQ